jgi:cell division protein FtsI/penicillin-binding protein 2
MESLKFTLAAALFVVMAASFSTGAPRQASARGESDSLFAQSTRSLLDREFTDANLSYWLVDLQTGEKIASRWDHPERATAVGSVVKPFAVLAYARHHDEFPTFVCRGSADRCWLPRGHGAMTVTSAIAQSCNAYFRKLSRQLPREDVDDAISRYGAGELAKDTQTGTYYGLGTDWRMSPEQMSAAFKALTVSEDRGAAEVRRGMMLSAREGTAQAIGKVVRGGALAKTGTAPCSHSAKAAADGFVVVMFPAESPRNLLVVRVHGTTGAKSAEVAAKMLRRIEEQAHAE